MSLTIYEDLEQGSSEWIAARAGIVTASVVGKLLTAQGKVANNDSSRTLTQALAAERITGRVEYSHPSRDMQRGTLLEPFARDIYAEHHGPVDEVGFMRRDEPTWTLGFSPDGLIGDHGLLEIKSRTPRIQINTIRAGSVPAANMAQLQAGLLVSGREWIAYVSYSPGLPLYTQRVYPIPTWQNAITQACEEYETVANEIVTDYEDLARRMVPTEYFDPFEQEDEEIT